MDKLSTQILQQLLHTPYACSFLTQLTNGTTNFVFRGILTQPLPRQDSQDMATTIIIKHSTEFAAVNRDFPIDVSRCIFEESMLNALNTFSYTGSIVKAPHLYFFNRETNTQVLEDFPGAVDLKTVLVSTAATDTLSQPIATSIGRALGSWLRSFHSWALAPSQEGLRREIWKNEPMRQLKYQISYDGFNEVVEEFPEILGDGKNILEEVKEMAAKEFQKRGGDGGTIGEEWGIIHGDFWSGNVLLPSTTSSLEEQQEEGAKLFIVDWEFAQFGHRAYDLGQMIGDLYERKHFLNANGAVWVMEGLIEGFGAVSEEMAFRTAIHTGVQLICWCKRGPPDRRPPWATPEKIAGVVKLGMDFVVKGWKKDRGWLERSMLGGLFSGN